MTQSACKHIYINTFHAIDNGLEIILSQKMCQISDSVLKQFFDEGFISSWK
jgi:hypothetical protein